MLVVFFYVKNRLLTTFEPEIFLGMGDSIMMKKIKMYVKYVVISVLEAISALEASSLASGRSLT
jgi:hypothetical protein